MSDACQVYGTIERIKAASYVNVVYLGGSLTVAAGAGNSAVTSWRRLFSRYMYERFHRVYHCQPTEVMAGVGALPAENMLLARYTPQSRHGLVFGIKFVLASGAAPLAVQLVAIVSGRTGDFFWVYALLAAFALVATCVALLLPRGEPIPAPRPAGAD